MTRTLGLLFMGASIGLFAAGRIGVALIVALGSIVFFALQPRSTP